MNKLFYVEYFLQSPWGVSPIPKLTQNCMVLQLPISPQVCQRQEGKCDTNSVIGKSHADSQLCGDPVDDIQLAAIWSLM
jgi:hypothetical protein